MSSWALPMIRVGDLVTADEGHYSHGLGQLRLRVVEVGRRERHTDGVWQHLRGVDLTAEARFAPCQRRVLVRLATVQIQPGRVRRQNPLSAAKTSLEGPGVAHVPVRPHWRCAGCQQDWPCPDRRARLRREYATNPVGLSVYMSMRMFDASEDLRNVSLYDRFLGWIRERPANTP